MTMNRNWSYFIKGGVSLLVISLILVSIPLFDTRMGGWFDVIGLFVIPAPLATLCVLFGIPSNIFLNHNSMILNPLGIIFAVIIWGIIGGLIGIIIGNMFYFPKKQ